MCRFFSAHGAAWERWKGSRSGSHRAFTAIMGRLRQLLPEAQQTDGAAQVAKHHQFLAEDLDPMGQLLQFVGKADRLPKAAQIFAAWCVGADMGEFCVFFGHLAMEVAAISRCQVTGSGDHGSPPFDAEGTRSMRKLPG